MAGLLPPDLEITQRLRLRSRITDGGSSSCGEHALPGMTCGPLTCLWGTAKAISGTPNCCRGLGSNVEEKVAGKRTRRQSHVPAREGKMRKEPGLTPGLSDMVVTGVVVSSDPTAQSNDSMI